MIDVHSFSELILYPWGDDENQTTNPSMNFLNPVYNGLRGNGGDTIYKEYIPADDLEWFVDTGSDIREAIADVRGHTYTLQQGFDLYPTTGTGGDYPYSRHFAQPSREKIYSFTLETGTEFQPPYTEASKVIEEGSAGLIQCLVNCLCIVEEATRGMALSSSIDDMRRFRDETLSETLIGRHYVSMLAKNKAELMQLMLAHKELRAEGVDLLSQVSQRVLSAKPRKFDVTLIKAIDSFGEKISEHSSKRLKEAISEVRRDLVHFSDQTTTKALEIVEKTRYQQD
jgi:hypothetical protein